MKILQAHLELSGKAGHGTRDTLNKTSNVTAIARNIPCKTHARKRQPQAQVRGLSRWGNCSPRWKASGCTCLSHWTTALQIVKCKQQARHRGSFEACSCFNCLSLTQSLTRHQSINQYIFNILEAQQTRIFCSSVQRIHTDKSCFLHTASYIQKTTTCIWFTQNYIVCNSTTALQEVQML